MKPNTYSIFLARRFWYWFWKKLMDGFAPSDRNGNYKRPQGFKINNKFKINFNKNENLYLLLGSSCPWCHRLMILDKLINLSEYIEIIYLNPNYEIGEWFFEKRFFKHKTLKEVYIEANYSQVFRYTLPLLLKTKENNIELISNESRDILNLVINNKSIKKNPIKSCNSTLLELINNDINDGVYKCGFSRNQSAYEYASNKLFKALDKIDNTLKFNKGKWILGSELSVADIYLFPTLIRWELIYSKLFKCTEKDIHTFKNIIIWRYNFYKLMGIKETCFEKKWIQDYYHAIFPLNPNQIIPLEPPLREIIKSRIT